MIAADYFSPTVSFSSSQIFHQPPDYYCHFREFTIDAFFIEFAQMPADTGLTLRLPRRRLRLLAPPPRRQLMAASILPAAVPPPLLFLLRHFEAPAAALFSHFLHMISLMPFSSNSRLRREVRRRSIISFSPPATKPPRMRLLAFIFFTDCASFFLLRWFSHCRQDIVFCGHADRVTVFTRSPF